jgi:hypothetical protein
VKLRVGRRNGRNLYVQIGAEPDHDNDAPVGMVDTDELAAFLVMCVNDRLEAGGYPDDYLYRRCGDWWRGDFPPGGP